MPGYASMDQLIDLETNELGECRLDVAAIEQAAGRARQTLPAGGNERAVWARFDALQRHGTTAVEPSDLASIRQLSPGFAVAPARFDAASFA